MKADIKRIHTISEMNLNLFNRYLSDIVKDLQLDGMEVEIQFQHKIDEKHSFHYYSALIIGRGK